MPGTLVSIGLNGPRISAGASGFMSQVSSWLGPPTRNSMMQFMSRAAVGAPGRLEREQVAERQAEQAQRARVQEVAALQAVAEVHRLVGVELNHGQTSEALRDDLVPREARDACVSGQYRDRRSNWSTPDPTERSDQLGAFSAESAQFRDARNRGGAEWCHQSFRSSGSSKVQRPSEVQRSRGSEVHRLRGPKVQRFRGSEVQRFTQAA